MDMDPSDDSTQTMMGMMTPWLHFTGGDNLFFKSLTPSSKGALAGAALVLFFIAVFERFLAAKRVACELEWRERAKALIAAQNAPTKDSDAECCNVGNSEQSSVATPTRRKIPPFIVSHDLARGAFQATQALVRFAIMLAIMTFQAAYIITIIIGFGIGEVIFGRQIALDVQGQYHTH